MNSNIPFLIEQIDRLIRRDPAQRGLIGSERMLEPLCQGHLAQAVAHLGTHARHVGVLTGFYVPHGTPPAAETDGPVGAVLLALALQSIGVDLTLITDPACASALLAGVDACGIPRSAVSVLSDPSDEEIAELLLNGPGRSWTHLIAIERVGPSHTNESVQSQVRSDWFDLSEFEMLVPLAAQDCCHNMRGTGIDEHTGRLHRLFDLLPRHRPDICTIGIGDGGNEIGMGTVPWEELRRRLRDDRVAHIACRIATHWNIVAGTSNWGAYAMAAALLLTRNQIECLAPWDQEHQRQLLKAVVERGPAVDGVTGRQELTVDGLPFLTYIQPWLGIRRLLGLPM